MKKITAENIYAMSEQPKVVSTPNDIYQNGGIVKAWIQKFLIGGKAKDFNTFSTQYANWNINEEFDPYSLYNTDSEIMGNKAQMMLLGNNSNTFSTKIQNKDGKIFMDKDGKNPNIMNSSLQNNMLTKINPADATLGAVNMAGDITTGALTAFTKSGSKGAAFAEGSQIAQSIVKPLEKIPIIGQASKLISGIIGGALSARKQGIEDEETEKRDKQLEYLTRNTITLNQPTHYGNYMAKYGANPKMMEQRVIDDIYSDFDKYMKKV